MPCIIALLVFGFMGIFSAKHRTLAKEAFDCVFRRLTLRPCDTGFDEKVRAKVVGSLATKAPWLAKAINKNFEFIAWIFFMLLIGSAGWTIYGGYNVYIYGSCNGLNESGFCVFDPSGSNNKISHIEDSETCSAVPQDEKAVSINNLNLSLYPQQNTEKENQIVFIGCYNCEYSKEAWPSIRKISEKYQSGLTFINFPVKEEAAYLSQYTFCAYKQDEVKFWELADQLFENDTENNADKEYVDNIIGEMGYNQNTFNACLADQGAKQFVENQLEETRETGVYGTPTVFVNDQIFIGPKPARVYKRALGKFW